MSAVDELTELVERAGAAERAALASRWKERADVDALRRHVRRAIAAQHESERLSTGPAPSARRARHLAAFLDDPDAPGDTGRPPVEADGPLPAVTAEDAVRAETDALAAVSAARLALLDAHLAVLDARVARIDAGDGDPGAVAVDGHTPLTGRNAVTRHGPALAHGLSGEIRYMLTRRPRSILRSLAVTLALGLGYLGFIRLVEWDRAQAWLPYLGLLAVSVVMGGAVCLNAMSFDAMRVRAALDSGARLWHLLITKNLALVAIVAPIGFLLSALLAWRAGNLAAFFTACALMISFIVLWLGVGNVLSVVVPIRDEPILNRRKDGTLRQFAIAFAVSYAIGYLVNLMLLWRAFAAQEMAARLGSAVLPAVLVVLSSIAMWILLTVVAVALAQQPRIRRTLMKELADYESGAEARAYASAAGPRGTATTGV
ncbi:MULTISPECIES: hypothetical protein [unclassified Pseudonocardia]|uniref:hypothetical protein n=2 Tax=unclassified Pseudonocardia TaxID=2619320 RepID=UPI00094B058C|nr:hypothetical protein [Pseudonocardia sp. Ae707_Ps1]OLM18277.1 hypothetical protein Ae707Ps1_2536 [Pseudonocardia sp. Ae707_Ps1]